MPQDPKSGVFWEAHGAGPPVIIGLPLIASQREIFGEAAMPMFEGYLDRLTARFRVILIDYANVLFHEFGHGLHMLMSRAAYPSLGPCTAPWDFIEVPSLLNEHRLNHRALIRRHLRHWQTGEAMPETLINADEAGKKFDRVFSVNLDYLAPALTDLRLHRVSDGRVIDPVKIEAELLAELNMPAAMDPMMTVTNAHHTWTEHYAAGLYVYLWADVIAANLANAFADEGLYDRTLAASYRRNILGSANTVPVDESFRRFRGRDLDTDAFKQRFELVD